ncbi:hypothetical protein H0H92_002727 [Tricholoma furcatifolium]|nr:hypothetical protein H0H92_002727 [Tricholoma furcatifolium]
MSSNKLRKFKVPRSGSDSSPTMERPISRTMELAKNLSVSLHPATSSKTHNNDPVMSQHGLSQPVHAYGSTLAGSTPISAQYRATQIRTAEAQLHIIQASSGEWRTQQVPVHVDSYNPGKVPEKIGELDRERLAQLERLVIILLGMIALLLSLVVYLFATRSNQKTPTHFTIPILSPFTSVIEHETSVIGSKTITLLILVGAALSYFAIRLRFGR